MGKYFESCDKSKGIRNHQYNQLVDYLNLLQVSAEKKRDEYFQPDYGSVSRYIQSLEKYRGELSQIIGYPPEHSVNQLMCREEYVGEDSLCKIYRLYISVAEGLECYGIYMVPRNLMDKAPLIISLHGGGGCPEYICNFEKTENYNDASRLFVKEGCIVFSPLFSFKSFADGENSDIPDNIRQILDARAKWLGTSLAAIEVFKVIRALDYLVTRTETDKTRIGSAGLSYGGFYSLLISAIDKRIGLCISSCYFNNRVIVDRKHPAGFVDMTWGKSLQRYTDVELVAMICPRMCAIELGKYDEVFPVEGAKLLLEKAKSFYSRLNLEERFIYSEFDGGHEFDLRNIAEILLHAGFKK